MQPLAIPIKGELQPSLDGTLLAGLDIPAHALTLYDLSGQVRGQYSSPERLPLAIRWLPDSSGLFIWSYGPKLGPLSIMDRHGKVLATGLEGDSPTLSPNGAWVAANRYNEELGQNTVEAVPRKGGAVQTLVQGAGVLFLGWQKDQVIYLAQGNIYAISPTGGGSVLLTPSPEEQDVFPPSSGPTSSPDGQAVLLNTARKGSFTLVGSQLRPYPRVALPGTPSTAVFWTGPHQALGISSQNELLVLDMDSGTIERHTGTYTPGWVEAMSGTWVAWMTVATGEEPSIHLTNFQTRQDINLGKLPVSGLISSLGQGRFVLHGDGETYLIDASNSG